MKLIREECRRQALTLMYLLCIVILVVNWYKNFYGITRGEIQKAEKESMAELMELDRPLLKEPTVEDDFFGIKYVENPELIMRGATDNLLSEYNKNIYATYPFGYYKAVSLDKNDQKRVAEILCEITGLSEEQLSHVPDGYFPIVNGSIIHIPEGGMDSVDADGAEFAIPEEKADETQDKYSVFTPQISYDVFKDRMAEMEKMIGKGSSYSIKMLITYYGMEEMTYEEAEKEFEAMLEEDRLTGGFARLFCDTMSGVIRILPVFPVVFLWLKDIITGSKEILYGKKISSFRIIVSRYLAGVILILVPVILLSFESLIPLIKFAFQNNYNIDYFAYLKYIICWILPTVMIVAISGTFFTILTDSPAAILIHLVWWVIDRGITDLTGGTTLLTLMIRHNTLRETEVIKEQSNMILTNRLFYVILSCLLLVLTVFVFEKKRRGRFAWWGYYTRVTDFVRNKFQIGS